MVKGIIEAYIYRLRKSIRSIIIYSVGFGGGITALVVLLGVLYPEAYTPQTRYALEMLAREVLGVHTVIPNSAIGAIASAIFSPYLASLIAALVASFSISGMFAVDRNEGVFEVLFSVPISRREILTAVLIYTLLAAFIAEAVIMAVASIMSLLPLYLLGYLSSLGSYYIELSLLLAPTLPIPAALISLFLSVVAPSLGKVRTGLTPGQNILNTISILPALIPFLILNIEPQIGPDKIAVYTAIASVVLAAILLLLLPHMWKEESLLRS